MKIACSKGGLHYKKIEVNNNFSCPHKFDEIIIYGLPETATTKSAVYDKNRKTFVFKKVGLPIDSEWDFLF